MLGNSKKHYGHVSEYAKLEWTPVDKSSQQLVPRLIDLSHTRL